MDVSIAYIKLNPMREDGAISCAVFFIGGDILIFLDKYDSIRA